MDINSIADFEKKVDLMLSSNTYDRRSALHLLKLYQFYPEKLNLKYIEKVLILTLTALPQNDFTLALYLLNEDLHKKEDVQRLINLQLLLETGNFVEFWKELKISKSNSSSNLKNLDKFYPKFNDSVKEFIAKIVNITFENVEKELLKSILNLSDDISLSAFLRNHGWNLNNHTVNIPRPTATQLKVLNNAEGVVQFNQLKKIIEYSRS
ncbi:hypothetical protein HDU92_003388 [Lobulomyces angularis]|nr:hypothetical protein HDU92_003388 [Lobulomyces angularis]